MNLINKPKIIFLDIDGVLNSNNWYVYIHDTPCDDSRPNFIDPDIDYRAVDRLNEIIKNTGAKIVLSSSWRVGDELIWERIKTRLNRAGIARELIIDRTPSYNQIGCVRGNEILHWIKTHYDELGSHLDYKNYVIIDDDIDMLLYQKYNFINTSFWDGLTDEHVKEAIKILNQ